MKSNLYNTKQLEIDIENNLEIIEENEKQIKEIGEKLKEVDDKITVARTKKENLLSEKFLSFSLCLRDQPNCPTVAYPHFMYHF